MFPQVRCGFHLPIHLPYICRIFAAI